MTSEPNYSDDTKSNKEFIEKYIESNAKAIEVISQAVTSSQKQNNKSRLEICILVVSTVFSALTFGAIAHNGYTQLKQNDFEQEQRAVEISLQLANYWETNFNDDTRRRLIRTIDNKEIQEFLAKEDNLYNSKIIKANKRIFELLELDSNANSSTILKEAIEYRTAIVKTLNTMETVSTVYNNVKSCDAKKIIAKAYNNTIRERYEQLKPFVEKYRKESESNQWQPLNDMLKNKECIDLEGATSKVKESQQEGFSH